MDGTSFVYYWITFTILVLAATAIAIVWAWRAGHFRDQDRARYLALWAEVPEDEASREARKVGGSEGKKTKK